jgi:hypothetical protein
VENVPSCVLQSPAAAIKPWELPSDRIDVIKAYAAEVIEEDGDDYIITFIDDDGELVEANVAKTDFESLPHRVRVGTAFGLVAFREKGSGIVSASVWPIARYWHQSLRADRDVEIAKAQIAE